MGYMNTGRALSGPPESSKPTAQELRDAMPTTEELKVMWDRLWTLHPLVAEDLDTYLTDYVVEMEYR